MPPNILNAVMPPPPTPMIDAQGYVTQPWLMFFLSLLKRTGGTAGVVTMPGLLALAADDPVQSETFSFAADVLPADAPEANPVLLLSLIMADPPPLEQTINPIMGGLLAADFV